MYDWEIKEYLQNCNYFFKSHNDFYNKLETSAKAATKSSTNNQPKAPKAPAVAVKGIKCPKCGGPMVLRKGPYGEFYGCKSYPKCRGILPKEDK